MIRSMYVYGCANNWRSAVQPMLSVENRQTLQRIDTGLVAMMRALEVVSVLCSWKLSAQQPLLCSIGVAAVLEKLRNRLRHSDDMRISSSPSTADCDCTISLVYLV